MASPSSNNRLASILNQNDAAMLSRWVDLQLGATTLRRDLISDASLREESTKFLSLVGAAARSGDLDNIDSAAFADVRHFLEALSASRARLGFSPAETATFVFSLKEPIFERLQKDFSNDAQGLGREMWAATKLIDKLGLHTAQSYQKVRDEIISRQHQELLELSTPVVTLWDGVVALPLIGTLDSARTQVVMENLLHRIVETGSEIAILDITGVPTVDTLVAQHLLKAVAAARLMGADCIISGIRPQIAQTIVHLGVDLGNVTTKATLADAFRVALDRTGKRVVDADIDAAVAHVRKG